MTTRTSDPDYWYDPDGKDAAMLGKIREAGEYRRSDPSTDRRERLHKFEIDRALARIAELEAALAARLATEHDFDVALAQAIAESIARTATHGRADEETYQNVFSETFNRVIRLTARIAQLEAEIARLQSRDTLGPYNLVHPDHLAGLDARIAEIETERGMLRTELQRVAKTTADRCAELEAERDRLTAMVMNAQHALDEVGAGIARRVLEEREACLAIMQKYDSPEIRELRNAIRARPAP